MAEVFVETENLLDGRKIILTISKPDSNRYIHMDERTAKLVMLALAQELGMRFDFGLEVAKAMRSFLLERSICEDSTGDLMQFTDWAQNYEFEVE